MKAALTAAGSWASGGAPAVLARSSSSSTSGRISAMWPHTTQ